jgi:hypothetical protein
MLVMMEIRDEFAIKDTVEQGWVHKDDISPSNPYCFEFSLANWQTDEARLKVYVWDQALLCQKGKAEIDRPVQDIYPVVATMTKPVNYERVMGSSALPVQAKFLAGSPVDEVTLVQFQERPHGGDTWTTFASVYSPSGDYFNSTWDNTGYDHDDQVDLRALFYDNAIPANVETTAFITVTVDKEGPGIELVIENAQLIDEIKYVAGDSLFLAAKVLDYENVDVKKVHFYRKKITEPDMYYQFIGSGNMENNYTFFRSRKYIGHWDTAYYHVKALAWDASGNDSSAALDSFFYKGDDSAPQVAIYKIRTDTMEWINPSKYLRADGKGMHVFVQAGKQVTAWHLITTPWDSMYVDNIAYSWDGFNLGNYGLNDSMTFNPIEDGIIDHTDLENGGGSYWAKLEADLTDVFGNTTDDHSSYLVVLDVTGNEVVITNPDNHDYRSDRVTLEAAALHSYKLESITYYYRDLGETDWIEIGTSTDMKNDWMLYWYTRNNVTDGWKELAATSKDKAGNISDPGPIIKVFICNTNPRAHWVWDDQVPEIDGIRFVGPHMDIRAPLIFPGMDPFDVLLKGYATKAHPDAAGIEVVWWESKDYTSKYFSTWSVPDFWERIDDSLYCRPGKVTWSDGWRHGRCVAEDSSGNCGYSDTVLFYVDNYDPYGRVVAVNSMPSTWWYDISAAPYEDTLWARCWDNYGSDGEKSGVDTMQLMIYNDHDDMVFWGSVYEPDSSTQYAFIWNNAGQDTGFYRVAIRVVDKVGNIYQEEAAGLRIEDHTPRVATVRAFHQDNRVYASVDMIGAENVTFQYYSLASSDWINLGIAKMVDAKYIKGGIIDWNRSGPPWMWTPIYNWYYSDTLWYTDWDPTTLPAGDYLFRCLAHGPWEDYQVDIRKPGLAKPMDAEIGPVTRVSVDADGHVTMAATDDIGTISFEGLGLRPGRKGVVKVLAYDMPYLLAIYTDLHEDVQGVRRIPMYKETGLDSYNSMFGIPGGIEYGGTARFYASLTPDTNWIEMGGFEITLITKYLGSNGPVWFMDGSAMIDVPGQAIYDDSLNLVGYPTPMPEVVSNECKKYTAIGNADGLLWRWHLFNYTDEDLKDYVKITLYYDHTLVTVPESQLQVARWHYGDYCWEFSHVESPVVDEANHSITFWTDRMGTYAVVQTPVSMWATVEVDPNCSDFSNDMPCFVAYIQSEYADIDHDVIEVKLGPVGGNMKTIYYDDTFADGYCSPFADWHYSEYEWRCRGSAWDPISGELDLCIMDPIKALAADDYVIFVEAYDRVGNYASAIDTFTVDAKAPKVTFLNGYVGKNPEFSFTIEDAESGVDTASIYIDMYSVSKVLYEGNSWVENRRYLGTYSPTQIDIFDGVVNIYTTLELVNNQAFDVVIYDGTYENGGPPATQDQMRIYHPGHGPGDCVGNQTDPVYQRFAIDDKAPTFSMITSTSARPVKIMIRDNESGVDWNSFKFMEDGTEIDPDTIDQDNGIVQYTPANIGVDVEINVADNMGNLGYYNMTTEAEELAITNAHNYPNPFDDYTVIAFDLSRSADVVVKIYDFAGDLVNTLVPGDYYGAGHVTKHWYGANDEGEDVANGVYLCHIKVNDGSHTASEVIKIAVVRKD